MLSLIFYLIHWIVVTIHDIRSLKECHALYSLRKLSAGLLLELKCKLSRLSLRHLTLYFIVLKFLCELLEKVCLSIVFVSFIDDG